MITTVIEHHAVLHSCQELERQGYEVTYLPVDEHGRISVDELQEAIRPDTVLITMMFANNEVGTIQPIREIGSWHGSIRFYFIPTQSRLWAPKTSLVKIYRLTWSVSLRIKLMGPKV